MRKLIGHCSLSGKQVFDILSGSPAEPTRIGKPFENAWRVTFVLAGGQTADMTFAEECLDQIETKLPQIWHAAIERATYDEAHRQNLPNPQTPKQRAANRDGILAMMDNVPLGILYMRKWTDIVRDSLAA